MNALSQRTAHPGVSRKLARLFCLQRFFFCAFVRCWSAAAVDPAPALSAALGEGFALDILPFVGLLGLFNVGLAKEAILDSIFFAALAAPGSSPTAPAGFPFASFCFISFFGRLLPCCTPSAVSVAAVCCSTSRVFLFFAGPPAFTLGAAVAGGSGCDSCPAVLGATSFVCVTPLPKLSSSSCSVTARGLATLLFLRGRCGSATCAAIRQCCSVLYPSTNPHSGNPEVQQSKLLPFTGAGCRPAAHAVCHNLAVLHRRPPCRAPGASCPPPG